MSLEYLAQSPKSKRKQGSVSIHSYGIDKYLPGRLHREAHSLPIWIDGYGYIIRLLWCPKVMNHTFDNRQNGFWILAIISFCDIYNTEQA